MKQLALPADHALHDTAQHSTAQHGTAHPMGEGTCATLWDQLPERHKHQGKLLDSWQLHDLPQLLVSFP